MENIKLYKVAARDRDGFTWYADFKIGTHEIHFGYTSPDDYSFNIKNAYLVFSVDGVNFKTGSKGLGQDIINELGSVCTEIANTCILTAENMLSIVDFFIKKHTELLPSGEVHKEKLLILVTLKSRII